MLPWGTLGDLATAAFVLSAVSGVALALPFNAARGFESLASFLLANPPATFFRNVHYWTAQLFLVLSLLHMWEHLAARTETRVTRGVWLRLTLLLPVMVFLMLSGFLLRGDADALQALRIVREAIAQIPYAGRGSAALLFGTGLRLDVIYVQHAAVATMVVWLLIIEHGKRLWPRADALLGVALFAGGLSLGVSPGLHDGLDPVVKGPWYFLGLQELLHWTPWPLAAVLAAAGLLGVVYGIRVLGAVGAARAKRFLLVLALAYGAACGVGAFLRGENWAWHPGLPVGGGNLRLGLVFKNTPAPPNPLPMALGRPEGCLVCHAGVTGLGNAHRPEAIGCASCHGGDPFSLDPRRAHQGMEVLPGSLATASLRCGTAGCHAAVLPRVERSVMTTLRGVVAIDRKVFGEPEGEPAHILKLGHSPADTHLRQLCAPCHLGAPKLTRGPREADAFGGGCLACHLSYSPEALKALNVYERKLQDGQAEPPRVHASLSLQVDNGTCFGCHSRSGRISTSYEGWHEVHGPVPAGRTRSLPDGRTLTFVQPDVHHTRGMDCIDCHSSLEVMGDGKAHARKSAQVRMRCQDCHAAPGAALATLPAQRLDPESRRILAQRPWAALKPAYFLKNSQGEALVNGFLDPKSGRPVLVSKRTGKIRALKPMRPECGAGGHDKLSCGSCHSRWTPRCNGCHTSQEPKALAYDWLADADVPGAWREKGGEFRADLPTLGIREQKTAQGRLTTSVDTFAPGMVMTLELPGQAASRFQRLYGRVEPHTTQKAVRSCKSCHNDPVALGYGRGQLRFEPAPGGGRWRFLPEASAVVDGMPQDAWIPFLGQRPGPVSTREDVRPFSLEEQRRILSAGACLTCHPGDSKVMGAAIRDFKAVLRRTTGKCRAALWN
jgi:hypothetical protein